MIEIIKRPVVTEKAMKLGELGQYVFEVNPNATKIDIRRTVEAMFEVKVISIRTVRIKGKMKTRMTRKGMMRGRTPLRKKAYVTLQKGQKIELVAGAAGA